jgi:hypothetical protein
LTDCADLPFLDRADTVAKERLSLEDLLEVAAHLEFEAVAAEASPHVHLGGTGRKIGRSARSAADRIEPIAQHQDAETDTGLLATQFLAGAQ